MKAPKGRLPSYFAPQIMMFCPLSTDACLLRGFQLCYVVINSSAICDGSREFSNKLANHVSFPILVCHERYIHRCAYNSQSGSSASVSLYTTSIMKSWNCNLLALLQTKLRSQLNTLHHLVRGAQKWRVRSGNAESRDITSHRRCNALLHWKGNCLIVLAEYVSAWHMVPRLVRWFATKDGRGDMWELRDPFLLVFRW